MSNFTIIGIFKSVQEAKDARRQIQTLFDHIFDARLAKNYRYHYDTTPTWAEGIISEQYGIEWNESIDWIDKDNTQLVTQFLNYIFVTNDLNKTRQSPHLIFSLIQKISDTALLQGSLEHERIILAEISCRAPQNSIALIIAEEFNLYLTAGNSEFNIPPWEMFSPTLTLSHELIKAPYHTRIDKDKIAQTMSILYRYHKAYLQEEPLYKLEEEAITTLTSLQQQGYSIPKSLDTERLQQIIHHIGSHGEGILGKTVSVSDKKLHISEIFPIFPATTIPAIHNYLQFHGCTDIEYSFTSVPYVTKPEYL